MEKTINKDIIYIGCDDHEIAQFEGQYMLEDGMCYNSYLVEDEKIAIMDTVDKAKKEEWLLLLEKALNGKTPDYIVVDRKSSPEAFYIVEHIGNVRKAYDFAEFLHSGQKRQSGEDYIIHPVFRKGSKLYTNNLYTTTKAYEQSGWDTELTGFWYGKFETSSATVATRTSSTDAILTD